MSHDEQAFLRAIIAEADSDTPRLIFADYLDENGQPERSELIRLQIELATLKQPNVQDAITAHPGRSDKAVVAYQQALMRFITSRDAIRRREAELLDEFWARWTHQTFDHLAADVGCATGGDDVRVTLYSAKPRQQEIGEFRCQYRRGFVSDLTLPWSVWLQHHEPLLACCPIRHAKDGLVRLIGPPVVPEQDADHIWYPGMPRLYKWPLANLGNDTPKAALKGYWPNVRFELLEARAASPDRRVRLIDYRGGYPPEFVGECDFPVEVGDLVTGDFDGTLYTGLLVTDVPRVWQESPSIHAHATVILRGSLWRLPPPRRPVASLEASGPLPGPDTA